MSVGSIFQVLSEPGVREALSSGIADTLGELQSFVYIAAAVASGGGGLFGGENLALRGADFSLAEPEADSGGGPEPPMSAAAVAVLFGIRSVLGFASHDPVVVVDGEGKVQGANRVAEDLAKTRFFFLGRDQALVFSGAEANKVFRKGHAAFFRRRSEQSRWVVGRELVIVFRRLAPELNLATVTMRRVKGDVGVSAEAIQSVLGVSPRQADLALAVMRGLGPVEYAKETGCKVKLARYHLYELMRKLEVHSQGELMNVLVRTFA